MRPHPCSGPVVVPTRLPGLLAAMRRLVDRLRHRLQDRWQVHLQDRIPYRSHARPQDRPWLARPTSTARP